MSCALALRPLHPNFDALGRTFSTLASVRAVDEKLDVVVQWMAKIVPHIKTLSFAVGVIYDRFSELEKKNRSTGIPCHCNGDRSYICLRCLWIPCRILAFLLELKQAQMMKTCVAPFFYGFVVKNAVRISSFSFNMRQIVHYMDIVIYTQTVSSLMLSSLFAFSYSAYPHTDSSIVEYSSRLENAQGSNSP